MHLGKSWYALFYCNFFPCGEEDNGFNGSWWMKISLVFLPLQSMFFVPYLSCLQVDGADLASAFDGEEVECSDDDEWVVKAKKNTTLMLKK